MTSIYELLLSEEFQPIIDALQAGVHSNSIIRTYPSLIASLKQATSFLPESSQLRRRIWHIQHNTNDPPKCSACDNLVEWKNPTSTYNTFCSKKCAQSVRKGISRSDSVIDKMKQTKEANPRPAWNKGIARTEQQNTHLSIVRRERFASGQITHWNTGNTTPDHVRKQISETVLSQHRTYLEGSKEKRRSTLEQKKHDGWTHPSFLKKGVPAQLSPEGRLRISKASQRSNQKRTVQKHERLRKHLQQYNLELVDANTAGFVYTTYTIKCNNCNTTFHRIAGVLSPFRYNIYNGKYCPTCFPCEGGILYSETYFKNNPNKKDEPGTFYLIYLYSGTEAFIKVGITSKSVEQRWQQYTYYTIEPVLILKTTLYEAFRLEQELLKMYQNEKYYPKHQFGGYTECLNEGVCDIIRKQIQAMHSS